mgnify:CR=1 FL=1
MVLELYIFNLLSLRLKRIIFVWKTKFYKRIKYLSKSVKEQGI